MRVALHVAHTVNLELLPSWDGGCPLEGFLYCRGGAIIFYVVSYSSFVETVPPLSKTCLHQDEKL